MNAALGLLDRARGALLRTQETRILTKGSLASLATRATGMGIRFLVGIVLARALGASGYGVYAYAITWLALLVIPATFGFDQVALRYAAAYTETRSWAKLRGLLRFSTLAVLSAGAVVAFVAVFVVMTWGPPPGDLRSTLLISFLIVPVAAIGALRSGWLRGFHRADLAQGPDQILYPLALLAMVGAMFAGGISPTPVLVAGANAIAWVVAAVVGSILLVRTIPKDAKGAETREEERSAWMRIAPSVLVSATAYYFLSKTDVIVLGLSRPAEEVGVYVVATRAAELMLFMYDAITLAGASLFTALHARGDRAELQRFTTLASKAIFWVSLPAYAAILFFAPWILLLFGAEFVVGAGALRILATFFFVGSLAGFVQVMLYATGHERDVAVALPAVAVVNVVGALVLVPRYGMVAAAVLAGSSWLAVKVVLVVRLFQREGILSLPVPFSPRSR